MMFLQQENTKQIAELVSDNNNKEQLNNILSTLAHNSNAEMEQAFKQSIRENPHDPTHRLIYADWLEEKGRPTEAHLHRLIAKDPVMMERLSGSYGYRDPSVRYRRVDGQRRRATPREATRTAYITTVSHTKSTDPDRKAREHARGAVEEAKIGDRERTIEHHYQAAIAHLQQANNVDWKTAGRLVPYSDRIAAHAHMIAAGVHKGEYPTEDA